MHAAHAANVKIANGRLMRCGLIPGQSAASSAMRSTTCPETHVTGHTLLAGDMYGIWLGASPIWTAAKTPPMPHKQHSLATE